MNQIITNMEHLIEALEQIKNGAEPINEMQMESWISTARSIANEALSIHDVSEMFDFAGYLYGNFDYYDNTEDGDIYIHNDNGLKYTREKVYQQWIGIRNSR
jgi:hypothetical protein